MTEIDPIDKGLFAAFGPETAAEPASDALAFLESRHGMHSRISLRDVGEPRERLFVRPLPATSGVRAKQLGKYQLLGEVGRGGVGIVLRAHDTELGRDIAIKQLRARYENHGALVRRFVEEAQIGGQLEHPGIVPVYDLGVEDNKPYFAMKLVQGRTLTALLGQRSGERVEPRRLLTIFEQVCQTMAYAHARGVIHRDLKPSNVMVGAFGEVQVMDWGMGKVLRHGEADGNRGDLGSDVIETIRSIRRDATESQSIVGSVMGTPSYMSPEQARGAIDAIDERSDVFALGSILVEILIGRPPYVLPKGADAAGAHDALVQAARECDLEPVFEELAAADASDELIALVRDCMDPEPAGRPADAGEVARRVSAYLTGVEKRAQASRVEAAEARVLAASARKSMRLTLALAAAVLLIVGLCVGGYAWVRFDADQRRSAAQDRLEEELQQASQVRGRALASDDSQDWIRAGGAAAKVEVLLDDPDLDPVLRSKGARFVALVAGEQARSAAAAAQRRRETAMLETLESILLPDDLALRTSDYFEREAAQRLVAYQTAFRDFGIDVVGWDADRVVAAVRGSAIRAPLITALADWAEMRRRSKAPGSKILYEMARDAEDDPWRRRLWELHIDPTDLLPRLEKLVASAPTDRLPPTTLAPIAGYMFSVGMQTEALDLFWQGWERYPQDFYLVFLLALALENASPPQLRESARVYTAARVLRPHNVQVAHRLAMLEIKLGSNAAAARILAEIVELKPDFVRAYGGLCEAYRRVGRYEEALAAGQKGLEVEPDHPLCLVNCAGALSSMGAWDEAMVYVERATEVRPSYATAWLIRGSIELHRKRYAAALACFDKALEHKPEYPEARHNLGLALCRLGQHKEGVAELRKALIKRPMDRRLRHNLAGALVTAGDLPGALLETRTMLSFFPADTEARVRCGGILFRLKNAKAAVQEFRLAVTHDPRSAKARYHLGNALLVVRRYEESVEVLKEAVGLDPQLAKAWGEMSEAYRRMGRAKEADEARRKALEVDPNWRDFRRRRP